MDNAVIQFPRPVEVGATRWQIWRSRMVGVLGHLCKRVGIAHEIRDCEIEDDLSGQHLKVSTSPRFTLVSVNGRDYYFNRFTGRLDGTGSGCA